MPTAKASSLVSSQRKEQRIQRRHERDEDEADPEKFEILDRRSDDSERDESNRHTHDMIADHARGGGGHLARARDAPGRENLGQSCDGGGNEKATDDIRDAECAHDPLGREDGEVGADRQRAAPGFSKPG